MKQLRNELRSNYSMLVMTWASKSNCEQRAGRVGRVADGRVYRLVPSGIFEVSIFDLFMLFSYLLVLLIFNIIFRNLRIMSYQK